MVSFTFHTSYGQSSRFESKNRHERLCLKTIRLRSEREAAASIHYKTTSNEIFREAQCGARAIWGHRRSVSHFSGNQTSQPSVVSRAFTAFRCSPPDNEQTDCASGNARLDKKNGFRRQQARSRDVVNGDREQCLAFMFAGGSGFRGRLVQVANSERQSKTTLNLSQAVARYCLSKIPFRLLAMRVSHSPRLHIHKKVRAPQGDRRLGVRHGR